MYIKKWQREARNSMLDLLSRVPEPKLRTERQMEEILHRYKVLARKRQIEQMKLDSEWSWEPCAMTTYTVAERRSHLLKVGWETLKYGVKQLMP